jgi:hypothetical protein
LSAGVTRLDVHGRPNEGYAARQAPVQAASAKLEIGAALGLTDWLRLRAQALAGLVSPRPVIRFDRREVASLAPLQVGVGLILEAGFGPKQHSNVRSAR